MSFMKDLLPSLYKDHYREYEQEYNKLKKQMRGLRDEIDAFEKELYPLEIKYLLEKNKIKTKEDEEKFKKSEISSDYKEIVNEIIERFNLLKDIEEKEKNM